MEVQMRDKLNDKIPNNAVPSIVYGSRDVRG